MHIFSFTIIILLSIVLNEAIPKRFISGHKVFTALVYNELAKNNTENNILVSPISAEIVLALAQSGAKDQTAEEIRTVLHLPNRKRASQLAMKYILSAIKGDEHISVHIANKIYVTDFLSLKKRFQKIALKIYQTEIENIRFDDQNVEAAKTINKWVEDHTNNKIQNIVDPNNLDEQTVVILVNALHFKAEWLKPFNNKFTIFKTFHKSGRSTARVEMMIGNARICKYYEDAQLDAKLLQLPFKNSNASMVFVLPNQIEGIKKLERNINKVFAKRDFIYERVDIEIPIFKVEMNIDFKGILSNLGVKTAFTPGEADFSEIAGERGDFFINKVKQKTLIEVNESGVEVAAATKIETVFHSARLSPAKRFRADHPFFFYIKYNDIVLFAGRILEPSTYYY